MLEFLHIENVAVVKTLDIEFGNGMIALTGETGAGKSIIIDSLNLLSGARADKELIRTGETRAEVSAVFSNLSDGIIAKLEELGFGVSDRSIMLSRTLTQTSSSARLNGKPINVSMLKEISRVLFGIHGQNDNMLLLDSKNHINILDAYANNKEKVEIYFSVYQKILNLRGKIYAISNDAREQNRLAEMLRFQIEEINSVNPKEGEEDELEAIVGRLKNAEKINKSHSLVDKALNGGKGYGAIYLAERAAAALEAISDAVPEADILAKRLSDVKYELQDISSELSILEDTSEGNPTLMLDKAESRLDAISRLKRKYGSTVKEIIEFRDGAKEQLDFIENAEDRKTDLQNELAEIEKEAVELSKIISNTRAKAAHDLSKNVCEALAFLDMPKVRFEVFIERSRDFNAYGVDEVEFLLSANPGEPLMPMSKIASGGELSRIMLSLKNVLNQCDGIDTVIFDEIDTGISGKTARKVGIKLKEIGKEAQVICVTHSAQIASLAGTHLYVSKQEENGRTVSKIRSLDEGERIAEIARILGGIEITDSQRKAAEEMIFEGKSY